MSKSGRGAKGGSLRAGAAGAALGALAITFSAATAEAQPAPPRPPTLAVEPPAEPNVMGPNDPLAGFSDGIAYLRSADNMFQMFPSGRLQVDAYTFLRPTNDMPVDTILLRRARLELTGWVGPWFYWAIGGDFAVGAPSGPDPMPQSFLAATDDYMAVAPLGDRLIFQIGQFDAPFTLENRTSDKYFDFMERSITVRAFGEPANKEVGMMLHGLPLLNNALYYSVGVFNGDGQNFKNVDNNVDVMGRGWIAPFAFAKVEALRHVTIGGSFWAGSRGTNGNVTPAQTTQGGFKFFDPKWVGPDGTTPVELHQFGGLHAYAFELNFPVMHRFGFRFEYVHKEQRLFEADASKAAGGKLAPLGEAGLDGWSAYGELWAWVLGDDRIIGEPGLQMPTRLKKFATKAPQHGVQLVARIDNLNETVRSDNKALGNPNLGSTRVIAPEFGVNYWYSKRFRGTFNYVANILNGDTASILKARTQNGTKGTEHEFLFRLAAAL